MRFDNIRMYQLIMLPQTELNTPAVRHQYDMKTKFRIMPRSFGRYAIGDTEFVAVESEEILVSNSTLPFEDYVACRAANGAIVFVIGTKTTSVNAARNKLGILGAVCDVRDVEACGKVANMAFLSSDAASYITGQVLTVDGGLGARAVFGAGILASGEK